MRLELDRIIKCTDTPADSAYRELGLHLAAAGMRCGERCRLWAGPQYGYGQQGSFSFPTVPPNADLVCVSGWGGGSQAAVAAPQRCNCAVLLPSLHRKPAATTPLTSAQPSRSRPPSSDPVLPSPPTTLTACSTLLPLPQLRAGAA